MLAFLHCCRVSLRVASSLFGAHGATRAVRARACTQRSRALRHQMSELMPPPFESKSKSKSNYIMLTGNGASSALGSANAYRGATSAHTREVVLILASHCRIVHASCRPRLSYHAVAVS